MKSPAAPENFVTIRVPVHGFTSLPCYAVVPYVPTVEIKQRSRKLVGWKAILEVSVAHGGPGSENRLRDLCRARGAPVYVWKGMAAIADEQLFRLWLDGLRVPIALEPVGSGGKGWRGNKKTKKARSKTKP